MPDLTTRLLAEIERREGIVREAVGFNRKAIDSVTLAYLGALREVVALHRPVQVGDEWICDRCDDANRVARGETCEEVAAVATALDVSP